MEPVSEKNLKKERKTTIKLYRTYMAKYKQKYYKRFGLDIIMGKRNGIYFWDFSGKRYINCHSNGGVFNLGHRHPAVLDALEQSILYVDIGNHHFISKSRADLAEILIQSLPKYCKQNFRVLFGVSGGEAVDTAIKLARGFTNRKKIVSILGGYHGHTGLALAAGDEKYRKPFFASDDAFVQVKINDLNAMDQALDDQCAAVLLESFPATLGMVRYDTEYIRNIREWTKARGILLIMDEIQTGLGRTGFFWGFEHYAICPDITVVGKGLSGGVYPITAILYRADLERIFAKDPFIHISTFGGAEIGAMVSERVVNISNNPDFLDHVNKLGIYFNHAWTELQKKYAFISEVRQHGLFIGIVLDRPSRALFLLRELMRQGIFAVYANNDKKVIQFLPPLITKTEQAKEIMALVGKALSMMQSIKNRLLFKLIGRKFDN